MEFIVTLVLIVLLVGFVLRKGSKAAPSVPVPGSDSDRDPRDPKPSEVDGK